GTTPTTPTPINLRIVLNFFIVISSCWALSRSRSRIALRQDLRRCEDDTVGGWVGSRRDCGLRRARDPSQELDAHQQSEILVHRGGEMVDKGSAIFAELDLERDRPPAGRTQSPDVLSDQPFGRRDRIASTVDGDAFLEVEMDRMVPAAAAVDISPVLDL